MSEVLKAFVHNEEMYDFQMEIMYERREEGLADALTSQLWETYGPTPTRLLQMWRWAKTNGAFLICDEYLDVACAHPACKVRRYYMEKYQDESKSLEMRLTDLKLGFSYRGSHRDPQSKELSELDPSLINFNERLWSDTADRLRYGELSSLSRSWTVSLTFIRKYSTQTVALSLDLANLLYHYGGSFVLYTTHGFPR